MTSRASPAASPRTLRGWRWGGGSGGQRWRVGAPHALCLPLPPPALRYLCRRAKYRCCAEAAPFLQIHDCCNTSQPPREEQSISRRVPGRREIQSWMPSSLVFPPLGAVGSVCECLRFPFGFGAGLVPAGGDGHTGALPGRWQGAGAGIRQDLLLFRETCGVGCCEPLNSITAALCRSPGTA